MTRRNADEIIASNAIQVPVLTSFSMPIGHVIYADTNGRCFTKCLDRDCQNPECLLKAVHDS